jgi:hypothetical protein
MGTRYYRYTLAGEHTVGEAQRALGEQASQGMIVRVDTVGGQTHLYVAQPEAVAHLIPSARREAASGVQVEEVSESDVTKCS